MQCFHQAIRYTLLLVVYFDFKCVSVEKYNKIKLFLKDSTIRTYFVVKQRDIALIQYQ